MTTGSVVVRIVLGAVGALMLLDGVVLAFSDVPGGIVPAFWGGVLLVGVLLEASRYRSEAVAPGAPFRPTEEVFVDPTSNRRMRVYVDSHTGERRYVAES